jgi:hypothetical protein
MKTFLIVDTHQLSELDLDDDGLKEVQAKSPEEACRQAGHPSDTALTPATDHSWWARVGEGRVLVIQVS